MQLPTNYSVSEAGFRELLHDLRAPMIALFTLKEELKGEVPEEVFELFEMSLIRLEKITRSLEGSLREP